MEYIISNPVSSYIDTGVIKLSDDKPYEFPRATVRITKVIKGGEVVYVDNVRK